MLRASGLDVRADYSASGRTVRIEAHSTSEPWEVERTRTHYVGRRSARIDPSEGSILSMETPCADLLSWQEGHSASEDTEQLGLSRTTHFRQLRSMRAKVEEAERVNRERDRSPEWDDGRRVVVRLGDVW